MQRDSRWLFVIFEIFNKRFCYQCLGFEHWVWRDWNFGKNNPFKCTLQLLASKKGFWAQDLSDLKNICRSFQAIHWVHLRIWLAKYKVTKSSTFLKSLLSHCWLSQSKNNFLLKIPCDWKSTLINKKLNRNNLTILRGT